MALIPRKTYPELPALTAPVEDADVLAVYRTPGPLRRTTAATFADYIKAFFSASGGSALVGFLQAGTGAVLRTEQAKSRDTINAADYGLTGTGDETATLQALLTAFPGKTIDIDVICNVTSTVTVAGDNTTLRFRNGAGIAYTTPTLIPFEVTGDNVTIEGLTVNAPATFDGANVQPVYGCIWVTGDNCRLIAPTLNNVPKVGISFSGCERGFVSMAAINGNFPSAGYTGTQTGHAGILIDAGGSGRQGGFIIESSDITGCVQGVLIANYGAASRSQGIVVSGNNFSSIWNHGVYGAGITYGNVVTGNTFVFCQVPVAMSGYNHVVSDNTLTTGGSSGEYTDETGISLRDPINCVVSNNTIQGETGVAQNVLNLQTSLGTVVRGNVVEGNTILITGAGSSNVIRLGGGDCTDLTDNVVLGNVCVGTGRLTAGIIQLIGASGCPGYGTVVAGNSSVARSSSYGIQLSNLAGVTVRGNSIRLEFDAASATVLGGVVFTGCSNCDVSDNSITVTADWGDEITYYGIWETGTASGNTASNNSFRADPTKLTSLLHYNTVDGSGIIVSDFGPGAPNLNAGVGSMWRRTNGGAGTTLYIKEVGSDAAGWVGK